MRASGASEETFFETMYQYIMRQLTNTLWDNSLINFESTHRHLIIFMRQFKSQTLWWSLILNLKNVVRELSQKMLLNCSEIFFFLSCFLYKFSWFPPSHTVMLTGRFGPARGILTRVVSAWAVKGPFLHYSLIFFTKLNTCPSVHSYTYNNAYIITFRIWPKQPKTEMTHSENWPKRSTP